MQTSRTRARGVAVRMTALAVLALTVGCRVDTHKSGDSDNVQIATPFGGMSVKTDDAVVQQNVGLSVYPGAVLSKKKKGDGDEAADINMSFGSFHLGVKALSYRTPDPSSKVIDFYRKDMARYGTVIFCRDNKPVGTPVRTQDGLSCDADKKAHIEMSEERSNGELKTGSKQHQHIVSINEDGSGTKIGLVALELPGNFSFDDGDEKRETQ